MRKRITIVFCLSLFVVLNICLCACGKKQGESVSEKKVSEESKKISKDEKDISEEGNTLEEGKEVSEDETKVSGKKGDASGENTPHPFANDNFIYMKKGKGIQQISKETGDIRLFANCIGKWFELKYVTEDALYYIDSKDIKKKEIETLYRVPIVKSSSKLSGEIEELDIANREEVLTETGTIWDTYVTEDYILYHFRDDYETLSEYEEEYAIKYDRKTKEKKYFKLESITYDICYAEGDRLIFGCHNLGDGYYCLDLKKEEMTHFATEYWDNTSKTLNPNAGSDGHFYYAADEEKVMVYDMDNKKEETVLEKKEIEPICKQVVAEKGKGKWKYDGYFLCGMFYYDNTLYLQVQLDWKRNKYFYMNYIMLSMDMGEKDGKLKYDEETTGLMQRDVDEKDDKEARIWWQYMDGWEDEWNFGRFLTIVDDTAVLILNDYRAQVATYDMKTGELQKVSKDDAGYYLPYSDSDEPYGNGNYELDDAMRYMPDEYED